ncbi:Phosphoinositide phospholipase C 5 [Dissostichus eleginoides]|uniref:Phosphoinositide phospholipase C 5 n=1 Tax=Dissostichus eleginoides TaxID=100907 RepID=A0AAD9BDW9_DISEL|nr:Phosphoinositide phospholipase C 5 [Dissostichus eleginoides]
MEVQSGAQQPEPRPLDSPRSGANQQDEYDDRQTDASGRPSADTHSTDAQPESQEDDQKVEQKFSKLTLLFNLTSAPPLYPDPCVDPCH